MSSSPSVPSAAPSASPFASSALPLSTPSPSPSLSPPPFPLSYNWNDNSPFIFGGSRKGAKQYQEDSFFSFISPNRIVFIGGIFDGHGGINGQIASNKSREFCKFWSETNRNLMETWSDEEWKGKLLGLFKEIHQHIRETFVMDGSGNNNPKSSHPSMNSNGRWIDPLGIVRNVSGDPIHGGTTGSVVVMIKSVPLSTVTIITANVGDSTCVLIPQKGKYEFLTTDHGPENPDEYFRVQSLPSSTHPIKLLFVYDKTNVFRKYECPKVFKEDGTKDQIYVANPWAHGLHPTNVRYEPAVYAVTPREITKDSTCIAMTRALGDFYAHQFGLTDIPDISIKKITMEKERENTNNNNKKKNKDKDNDNDNGNGNDNEKDMEMKMTMDNESDSTSSPSSPLYLPFTSEFTIMLASDGVWDCWKYEDFQQYVLDLIYKKNHSLMVAGETVLEESITRAITNFGNKHYDDAAVVGWKLEFNENSKNITEIKDNSASTSRNININMNM